MKFQFYICLAVKSNMSKTLQKLQLLPAVYHNEMPYTVDHCSGNHIAVVTLYCNCKFTAKVSSVWVFVGQRAADLQAVKVGGSKKILPISLARGKRVRTGPLGRIFFGPPTLMAGSSAVLWLTETHSTSLERSKPPLLTQALFKSLVVLLRHFISSQNIPISIEPM